MVYSIDLSQTTPPVLSGHLHMGGTNSAGVSIQANSRFLSKADRPWLPVMGEMHYARYPAAEWRAELLKMKMGGIQVVATYVFWIHHEEIAEQFEWGGQRSLRAFLRTCAACGLLAFPRIGPWSHGECRNGGFPDWLLTRCGTRVRQDCPEYLRYTQRFYAEIARQLDGLLWKDDGPVIGIQVENELLDNAAHLLTLKRMARAAGIDVPLYTQTGWGPAELTDDELIPVFGGYPDAFWERDVDDWARNCRKHYFFSPVRDENTIGADLLRPVNTLGAERDAQLARYCYGTCECGGGMAAAYHRRPLIHAEDVSALAMVKIGSGSNLQGYYMYHGGANPTGKRTTLQESQATGYGNDLPVMSYDFQAPLGEYGQVNDSYHALRPLHLFLADFGDRLAPLPLTLPEVMPTDINDRQTLRWAARADGQQAFVFVNNYQRREDLSAHAAVQFLLRLGDETIGLPSQPVHVDSGSYFFWPVNFVMEGLTLTYASMQPVCRISTDADPLYVFVAQPGIETEVAFVTSELAEARGAAHHQQTSGTLTLLRGLQPGPGCMLALRGTRGQRVRLLVLRREDALRLYKAEFGGAERLLLSPANLFIDGEDAHLRSRQAGDLWLAIYPDLPGGLHGGDQMHMDAPLGIFTRYVAPTAPLTVRMEMMRVQGAAPASPVRIGSAGVATVPEEADWDAAETWQVRIPATELPAGADAYIVVDYVGDSARAYVGEQLVADDFYSGRPWEIGLRRYIPTALTHGLTLRFLPMRQDAPIYLEPECRPNFIDHEILHVRDVHIVVEYAQQLRARTASLR